MDETWVVRGEVVGDDDVDADAARSDTEAFGRLYNRHRLAVFRYLRARGFDEDDASDLTALTFERALVRIDHYRPGGAGFLPWLFVIARNAAVDAHRRKTVAGRFAFLAREPAWGPSAEDLVLRDESDQILAERIQLLPPHLREVIVLRFAAGLSAREIGQVIGRTEGASAKLVSRALAALKFQVPMSAAAATRIESRVGPAMRQRAERRVRRPLRRSLLLALGAVLLVTAGAAAVGTLFERIADSGPSDYRLAWEEGSDVGVSVDTPQGPVTVVRGYADRLRVVLAIQAATEDQFAGSRLTDESGRQFMPNGGPGYVSDAEGTGFLLAFVPDEPLTPGPHMFSFTSEAHPERAPITFELTVKGGEPIRNGTPLP